MKGPDAGIDRLTNYVASAICGARMVNVSVEPYSRVLTPHIFVWMIGVHHRDGESIMYDKLFRVPAAVARYRAGPYAKSREQFLKKARADGYSPATVGRMAWALLIVAEIVRRAAGR